MLNVLKIIPTTGAALSGATLILSISYNFGFFTAIDRSMLSAMTLSDHVSSGIEFIPISALTLAVGFAIGLFAGPGADIEDETDEEASERRRIHYDKTRYSIFFISAIALLIPISWFFLLDENKWFPLFISSVVIVPYLLVVFMKYVFGSGKIVGQWAFFLFVSFFVIGMFFVDGHDSAITKLREDGETIIQLENGDSLKDVNLLRIFDRITVIVYNKDVYLIKSSNISSIKYQIKIPNKRPFACRKFNWCVPGKQY